MYDLTQTNNTPSTAPVTRNDDNEDYIVNLTSAKRSYSSLPTNTMEEKAIAYNAMNNPAHRISEMINREICIKDIYVETVECVNEKDGTVAVCPRIVLVDTNGEAYSCVSVGMFGSLEKLIRVYGEPTWTDGILVEINQNKTRRGMNILTLKVK